MATTRYLVAKDSLGRIVAKRATLGFHDYKFATKHGSFHSRLDLVPAGTPALPVEEITAAEYRKLVAAKTEDPARLQRRVDMLRREITHHQTYIARLVAIQEAYLWGKLEKHVRQLTAYNPPREQEEVLVPGELTSNGKAQWWSLGEFSLTTVTWARSRLEKAEKSLAAYEKRLARALKKAAA
jgi:hypothetical protein